MTWEGTPSHLSSYARTRAGDLFQAGRCLITGSGHKAVCLRLSFSPPPLPWHPFDQPLHPPIFDDLEGSILGDMKSCEDRWPMADESLLLRSSASTGGFSPAAHTPHSTKIPPKQHQLHISTAARVSPALCSTPALCGLLAVLCSRHAWAPHGAHVLVVVLGWSFAHLGVSDTGRERSGRCTKGPNM